MPQLPHSIELHDSQLVALTEEGDQRVIKLSPAYVHQHGKGWLQDAEITIGSAEFEGIAPELPVRLADGTLKTPGGHYQNLLVLPLKWNGSVLLELEFSSGNVIRIKGASVSVELPGTPTYLEDLA